MWRLGVVHFMSKKLSRTCGRLLENRPPFYISELAEVCITVFYHINMNCY